MANAEAKILHMTKYYRILLQYTVCADCVRVLSIQKMLFLFSEPFIAGENRVSYIVGYSIRGILRGEKYVQIT